MAFGGSHRKAAINRRKLGDGSGAAGIGKRSPKKLSRTGEGNTFPYSYESLPD